MADLICGNIRKFIQWTDIRVYTEWAKRYTPVQTAIHDHYDNDSHN